MMNAILIVEDDTAIRVTLVKFLKRFGFDVSAAESAEAALKQMQAKRFRLALLDLRLPDGDGMDLIGKFRELDDSMLIVIMTAFPEIRTAVAALKAGAYDYITKPFDLDDMRELVVRTLETSRLRREVAWRRVQSPMQAVDGFPGSSPAWRELVETVMKISAAGRVPVLIRGESGSGKEGVARSIHCLSPRADGPWVTLNCSALPEGLLESEMFGHEKGAFTGAHGQKRGLLELADGGTLFLDEIGDLSLALQPKLLRVLETQTFRRVGGSREISVDVRFVAATHRDLKQMVADGSFREDLFYRLNVGTINVPPLRERRQDIIPLAQHFLREAAKALGLQPPVLNAFLEALLENYRWPGNIRELRNVMERAVILAAGEPLDTSHLPREITGSSAAVSASAETSAPPATLEEMEKKHILRVLETVGGNKTRAAEYLGITRLTLRNKLKHYGLEPQPDNS